MFDARRHSPYAAYGLPAVRTAAVPRWVYWLAWGDFAFTWGLIALIQLISEQWWLSTVLVYLPRSIWLIPALIVLGATIRWGWKPALINLGAVLLVLGPVMNWQAGGLAKLDFDPHAYRLTVVSCNVQSFRPDFAQVVNEMHRIDPDVVLFQEAFEDHALVATFFDGWNLHRVDEYLVASKLPLKYVGACFVPGFERVTVVRYEVQTPLGPVSIFDIHQTSPRRSLTDLKPWSILTGSGVETVELETTLREIEAMKTREFTLEKSAGQPAIMAGDFNMPNDSSLFRQNWGDLRDAYALSAVGYGYTSPCRAAKLWPTNTPWAQVDHILTTHHWQVERCWIGESAGSDHRLIAAQLRLPRHPGRPKSQADATAE